MFGRGGVHKMGARYSVGCEGLPGRSASGVQFLPRCLVLGFAKGRTEYYTFLGGLVFFVLLGGHIFGSEAE